MQNNKVNKTKILKRKKKIGKLALGMMKFENQKIVCFNQSMEMSYITKNSELILFVSQRFTLCSGF